MERMVGAHVSLVSKEEYVKYGSVVSPHLCLLFLFQHQERKAKMARINIIMWLQQSILNVLALLLGNKQTSRFSWQCQEKLC